MKLTPLNITLACILVWAISDSQSEGELTFSWPWLIVLVVMLVVLDLVFRLMVKDFKKMWMLQIGFILVVSLVMVILKTM